MKFIVMIMSCAVNRETRQESIRNTWMQHVSSECFFYEGSNETRYIPEENRLLVSCPDDYENLALKTYLACKYIADNFDFDFLVKCDDDTYVNFDKLNNIIIRDDYTGYQYNTRDVNYMDGGGYVLSRKAVELIAQYNFYDGENRAWWYGAGINDDDWKVDAQVKANACIEDMMVGDILNQYNIDGVHNKDILFVCREWSEYDGTYKSINKNCLMMHPLNPSQMTTLYEHRNYFIKSEYICNDNAQAYLDNEEDASIYQLPVYEKSKELIQKHGLQSVLDIGCGHGMKLREFIYPVCQNIVGIDLAHSIDYCQRFLDFGEWYVEDIENPTRLNAKFDLIICADVIEHLFNPDKLFEYIDSHSTNETLIVLSTPERDLHHGKEHVGPPVNKSHIREWNGDELQKYFNYHGYEVLNYEVGEEREGRRRIQQCEVAWDIESYQWAGCQIITAKKL